MKNRTEHSIQIRGARQNNLKGIDLDIPIGKLTVVSGPSGSGKSSFAFDTLYAEGQRRYVETFSPYTRQFLERMDKPKVDEIRGIPPAIAIEQANPVKTTRSTVGTMTEINDYLKLLFPRIAGAVCPSCQRPIRPETAASIVAQGFAEADGETALVTFGVPAPAGTKAADFFAFLQSQGYLRVWIDGAILRTDEPARAPKRLPAVVRVIQDRIAVTEENRPRLFEAVETALRFGKGQIAFIAGLEKAPRILPHSSGWHCAHCDVEITPPSPGLFSFNSPLGACPTCRGFGRVIGIDLERAIPDRSLSLKDGAVKPFQTENGKECQRDLLRGCAAREVDVRRPFAELPKADQDFVLYGEEPGESAEELWKNGRWYGVRGFFNWLESKAYKMHVRVLLSRYRSYTTCPDCRGGRFQPEALNFQVAGKTLPQLAALPVDELWVLFKNQGDGASDSTTEMLRGEVCSRLRYLVEVGLGYLSLDRPTRTLSGGEVERVNLTTCLGASLVNTLFVMDEPTVGLHPRDVGRLIGVMHDLRDRGNTLVVVEHEEAVLRAADNIVEIGPGRGEAGGELVYSGPLAKMRQTLTSDYLSGRKTIPIPAQRRAPQGWLRVHGAAQNNLRGIGVDFPLGVFTCITGVSGSGKSTLVHEVLYRNLLKLWGGLAGEEEEAGTCREILGAEAVGNVVMVDQSSLSRTPRSSPIVYLDHFDAIRERFAMLPEAMAAGFTASSFSFNSGTGRCDRCSGMGFEKIEMQFLSDLFVRCPECDGKRYQPHVLRVRLRGKSIADVLEMTVTEASTFFEADANEPSGGFHSVRSLLATLRLLSEVGLGYLRLGQPLNVLSGGESQRLKLVSHLAGQTGGNGTKGALLILDEPTTGLHFDDVAMLLRVFDRLVEQGNTLLVIEHNLEVIKCADHLIDLGPEAGAGGGLVVATGTPEELVQSSGSHTGAALGAVLGKKNKLGSQETRNGKKDKEASSSSPEFLSCPSANLGAPQSGFADASHPMRCDAAGRSRLHSKTIQIHGAREHNLKNISLAIPRDQLVVVTGLSGSGKSTLAFDILFAEGQRRFLDSMSVYARQFVEQLEKPDVDLVTGLPPSVAIEQRVTRGGGKSTVATVTEVYHFLRLLFAKLGTQYCPACQLPVEKQSFAAILKKAESAVRKRGGVRVLAPLVKARKGFHSEVARWATREGYEELLVDGRLIRVADFKRLERFREHTIDVVVGERRSSGRLEQILRRALEIGKGTARLRDAHGKLTVLSTEMSCPGCGESFEELDPRLFSFNSPHGWCDLCHGFGEIWEGPATEADTPLEAEMDEERRHEWLEEGEAQCCPECHGTRLNEIARNVRLQNRTLGAFVHLPVSEALAELGKIKFSARQKLISADILPEIRQRLEFMGRVGLDYLGLDRSAKTLSGGESQRIRLAAQLGSNLRGVLYVLDEPTIGLHPRDNEQLLCTLEALRAKGNSLVVVEHDEETMRRADTIIDLGPGAGSHGGEVVCIGNIEEIRKHPTSETGRCLREPMRHPIKGGRRSLETVPGWIELRGARANNLQNIDVRFPVGRLTVLTGISGSGKSSLMRGVLRPALERGKKKESGSQEARKGERAGRAFDALSGAEFVETVYEVDQSPIGKTSRSTPATYIKVFDEIRKQFATLPLARMRGYTASRFSFNTSGGRCETCAGQGVIKIEMNFLPASYIPCGDCHGKRYNAATLEVLYNDRSIGDVMEMTLETAADFFGANPKIARPLRLLCETGLGYLKLGQPSPTLSGGEAQRLKLVSELTRGVTRAANDRIRRQRTPKSTVYLLEEPTIGLHMADVERLLDVLHRLVDDGQTVIVIEHNTSLIAEADYVVDIGPEAGPDGGKVVAHGTPEQVAHSKESRTAPFLKAALGIK
ncbi:MAG: excinuclease ABC subunit UvrA [Verrucomicrobia bacterium]|nr:excinuclease ABC subunit UvrA [Verrucomicrobiota bacterium]